MNRHTVSGRWKLGLVLAMFTAFQFGAIPIVLKLLLRKVDPYTLSWYRFTAAAIFLGCLSFRSHDLGAALRLRGKPLALMIAAILGLSLNYVLYTIGLDFSTPNTAQVMIQLAPVLLGLGGLIIFKETFSLRQTVGVVILVTGLILFFDDRYDEILEGASSLWLGIVTIAISAALWATYGLAQKQLLTVLPGRTIMFTVYCAGSILYLVRARPLSALVLTHVEWLLMLLSAAVTAASYVSLAAAMNHLEASRVSVVLATPPLFTVAMVALLTPLVPTYVDPEPISYLTAFGICLVVLGSTLASLQPSNSSQIK